jgi:chromosomal replication initiation ATPase DnaA
MSVGIEIFGTEEQRSRKFRGFNPAYVRKVWAKRRDVMASIELAEPVEEQPKTAAQTYEEKAIARHREAERLRVEKLKSRMEAGGVRGIIAEVALAHRVTVEDILGSSRSAPLVKARHEAIIEVAIRRPAFSLPQIGRCFSRDHTTILHVLRKYGIRGK